jgi:peptidoglycan/xylan/chitin deacetylase (PgdA/CDA1 family)
MIFRLRTSQKEICLTFDDGPDPDSTPGILDILGKNDTRAIFFCTGIKAEAYPDLTARIVSEGHMTGNHGYLHLDGWRTSREVYTGNVRKAAGLTSGYLFRPPYGRLKPSQYRELIRTYHIMGWDLMPYDFDSSMGKERLLSVLREKIRPGTVIVLHDKAGSLAPAILDEFISHAHMEGYRFILPDLSNYES